MSAAFRTRILGSALSTALLLVAVCAAALSAHVAIDAVGDVVLRHDTYDDVTHASRIRAVFAAFGLFAAGLFGFAWSALDPRIGRQPLRLAIARHPLMTGLVVFALSVVAVAGMETMDALLAGSTISGVAESLGGSLWLGLALTLCCSVPCTAGAVRFARFVARAHGLLVRALVALAVRLRSLAIAPVSDRERRAPRRPLTVFLGRAHKRGPPLTA